jgi:ABC-type nitrate/sulfonate/bicarbonate transport system ATPase subunit
MPGVGGIDLSIAVKRVPTPNGAERTVLRDVRLAAGPGQIVALLGRSGVGKTTLLRIVLGLDTQFEGRVRVPDGRAGVVFQDPTLLPWLSVADNLRLVMGNPSPARIEAELAAMEVAGAAGHLPSELSLGMARRVALARALSVDPALLVLDEPFASLDPRLGATLAERVATRARKVGSTVLLATHDLAHALAVADRICVLAGFPATLAADVAVPERRPDAIERLRADLVDRFAFLAATEEVRLP